MDAKQSALGRLTEDGWMARSTTKKGFGIIGVGLQPSMVCEHTWSSCCKYEEYGRCIAQVCASASGQPECCRKQQQQLSIAQGCNTRPITWFLPQMCTPYVQQMCTLCALLLAVSLLGQQLLRTGMTPDEK
jgi:hypothetical protein